jgi:hypothetical protein
MMFIGVMLVFGIAVQVQGVVLALLRAVDAVRLNILACLVILIVVPCALVLVMGDRRDMESAFGGLATAFMVGTASVVLISRRVIANLFTDVKSSSLGVGGFIANASSFTLINAFTYGIVNIDFSIFRLIGTPSDFAVMAASKVFFERFVLPTLLVLAGAVSLNVLRYEQVDNENAARLRVFFSPLHIGLVILLLVILTLAHEIFANKFRVDNSGLQLTAVVCISFGYMFFAFNGILFDVLVVRKGALVVLRHVLCFLVFGGVLQIVAIMNFGLMGWSLGWLVFNIVIFVILAKEGLQIDF